MRRRPLIVAAAAAAVIALAAAWIQLRRAPTGAPEAALQAPAAAPDGCIRCHAEVTGLGDSHDPKKIGCASCHAGNAGAAAAAEAHAGMILVPGNVADARLSCGQAACHVSIAPRIESSIMTTMAGVIAVNRHVLGERFAAQPEPPRPARLTRSVADSHLRELCVSCHLGQTKSEWGPIGEESRGGGCNACHLVYDAAALADLQRYAAAPAPRQPPRSHPAFTVNPGNGHCFGCHSRSGRIATSYEGWHELRGEPPAGADPSLLRRLDDGRWFEKQPADVHHERGMQCIDCHTSAELMGTGAVVARKSEQQTLRCEDCHARRVAAIEPAALDPESRTLLALRQWRLGPGERVGATRAGAALVNVVVPAVGAAQLRRKASGPKDLRLPLSPPLPACTDDPGHARLACASCHSAWAPRCTTCHTTYDPQGEGYDHVDQRWGPGTWNETAGPYEAAPPTLGMRLHRKTDGKQTAQVETFVPGMIMTFDRNRDPAQPPDLVFRRLYAQLFAHTIQRRPRDCRSCHADPVALGYGQGRLRFDASARAPRWQFTAAQPALQDGLPADAWIGFLQTRKGMVSTRDDVRPLSVEEQRRVLTVGACLGCHAGDSPVMRAALKDFAATRARMTADCRAPAWR